jgi:hypothetical protein
LRRPWCILDLLNAPLDSQSFTRWARSQVLRQSSALTRRYEVKYASWPYKLHTLCSQHSGAEDQRAVAESLLNADRCCLDTFAAGLRARFTTVEELLSSRCRMVVAAAFRALRVSTDFSERQHAEINSTKPTRSGARDFTHFARSSLLKQVRTVHMKHGGADPSVPADLRGGLKACRTTVMPFLQPLALK